MPTFVRLLGLAVLRHYRDPLSWAGIIAAVAASLHWTIPPEYMPYIESIGGTVVGILLLKADGRSNPNTTANGSISERPIVPAGTSPVFTPTSANGHGAVIVPAESIPPGSVVVSSKPASDIPTQAGRRPGMGPY